MNLREYKASDKEQCITIFKSNFPKFFDESELEPFVKWLDHQLGDGVYSSPTYSNSEQDAYYVIEDRDKGIIGCGGFYILKDQKEARLAWGMIHSSFHKHGYGTALYNYRKNVLERDWPKYKIVLGTSQHTFSFYQKMGMKVTEITKAGYGPNIDKYDMVQN
jgi:ribosomal-protein-alanine N-acetyltransferase